MHRESRPQPRSVPLCAYCQSRTRALEPADRHALRRGVPGHVECRWRAEPSALSQRGMVMRGRLAYAALIASPLIEFAASGAPLSTIAA
jgi:hypothetical protein